MRLKNLFVLLLVLILNDIISQLGQIPLIILILDHSQLWFPKKHFLLNKKSVIGKGPNEL